MGIQVNPEVVTQAVLTQRLLRTLEESASPLDSLQTMLRQLEASPLDSLQIMSLKQKEEFFAYNVTGSLLCVAAVALFAGLFLGYLTLDAMDLKIIQRASIDEEERTYAAALLPIVKERHRLLVTLLIMNTLAYEAMPIFLDALVPSWVAILLSTTLILLFGEILPSGFFTGPKQLFLAYKMVPLVKFFLWLVYPVAMPMTMLLDYLVHGHEKDPIPDTYNRGELSALVRIQHEERAARRASKVMDVDRKQTRRSSHWTSLKTEIMERVSERPDLEEGVEPVVEQLVPPLHAMEVTILEGSLQLQTHLAMDVYTPYSQVFAVPDDMVLDKKGVSDIYFHGYSRVPVYDAKPDDPNDKSAIMGVLMARQLMLIDWDDCREVSTLPLKQPDCVSPRINLVDLLRKLRSGGFLMALVCARPDLGNKALNADKPLPPEAGFMGIVTLEDIMESILGERIYDEEDIKERDRAVATLQRWAATTLQSFLRRKTKNRKENGTSSSLQANLQHDSNKTKQATGDDDETAPLLSDGYEKKSYT